ncbi:hypothetical protein H0H81_009815 [Sphagnurus paluster]|uniref:Uncharacterized protein n=1 Tax=Sphagnurus paluster TaxID=117069 RepID=A0A9P7K3X9_9AGAR|nr:hypothetical protein H0H81_009815 [Sphagnurus paluster]
MDDKTVLYKITQREQPADLAAQTLERGLTDDFKKLMKDCWKYDASDRPSINIEDVVSRLDALNLPDGRALTGFMDRPFLKKVTRKLKILRRLRISGPKVETQAVKALWK